MARLMSESTGGPTSSTAASTSNVASSSSSSSSPRSSRKPSMATEETNTSSPHRSNLQRTPSAKLHSKTTSPPRKPSFRKIRPGGPKLGYRATKVATVPSNSVALLASQFNAVVVPNDAEGRKLLKRLNSQKQILQKHVIASTTEGCVRARIKKFELGGMEQETQGVRSEVSQQNNHHKLGRKIVVERNVSNVVKNVTTESSVKHHRLGNLEKKNSGNDVQNVTESSTSHHKLNSMVEKNVGDSENIVGVKHQNNSQHQYSGHQNGSTHQNNASSSHHQQAERPKFVIVRKNSIISKFSRKTSIKSSINPAQSTPRLPNIDSKDALHGSSVSSSGTSPTKAVRKLSNPPKLCPKPQINQRTIFLKPVLSRYPVGALLKDSVEHGEKVSRTVRENTSTTIIMKDEGDSKDQSRRIVARKGSSDSVFCSDEENGKTSEGVPKTVKKIWRRYQVTNTRSITSIARDFMNSDSSIDGSVVKTLKYVGDNEHKPENNGGGHQDVVVKKCEGCGSGGGMEVERKVHSGTCHVQRRVHRENEESKVKKEEFRKYLVKSEHIVAVQNELMSTNKKPEMKSSRLAANKKQDGKEMRICVDVDKECKRYGRIIVGEGKVLKSLVNDGVEEDNLVINKENIDSKSSAKPVLDQDNLAIDKENLLLKNTINNVVGDNSIVDKENLENVSDNQTLSAKNGEDLSEISSGTKKSQVVVKPKLQPKPSKVPDSRRKVQVVSKVITSPAKSKPIAVFGLSVAKDQTVLESALNGGSLKGEDDVDGEKVVVKSINGQKNLAKPNRSFLWNTLKDKESNQNLIVPKQEEEKNDSSKDPVVPKTENIIPVEPVDNKVLEEKLKPQDVLDTNTRNTLDSKVKNTSFLFRKSIKSLPADDCLDEPIYMNGQVALSTSDIESRSKSSEMCSNFNSMVSLDGGLDRAKARVNDVGSNSFATKNVSQSGRSKDLLGSHLFTTNNSDENGRNVGGLNATKNGQIGEEQHIRIDECSEVYEDFGNSDSEGTIYEEVDGSPERSPGLKYIITEARSSNIVETVNQVLVVSRQGSGYEEIKRVDGKSSDGSLGQEIARNIGSKTNLPNVGHNSARNVVLKSNLQNLGTNLARNVDPRGSTKDGVVPRKESLQVSQDNSGSRSTWYAIDDPNPNLDTKGSSEHYSGSKSPSYTYIDPNVGDLVARKAPDDTYASIPGEDFSENIYDVLVHSQLKMPAEGDSCHYEDIYQSELAGSSQSDSSCDQSNSLYGVVPGHQISQNSLGVYQLNEPEANTSETSDEWVDDIDTSGGDVEIYLYEKRNKPKVKTSSSWSQKVRRQWSANQAGDSSWDGSDCETSSHQYEPMLHTQQSTASINSTSSRVPHFNFDSDSSFEDDDEEEEARRKAIVDVDGGVRGDSEERTGLSATEGIYGLMKQASKRMRKHWSLGKSLRMIRKMSSSAVLGGVEEQPQDTVTNGSTTSLNRRRWSSFKSRFKPQLSSSGSIFYLDKDHAETPDCIPNVYSDKPTPTTPPSVTMATGSPTTTSVTMATVNNKSTTPPAVTMATDPRRYSIASSSLRPTSPPPPPPPHSASSSLHRQSLCEEVLAKRGGLRSVARGGRREDVGGVERVSGSDRGGGGKIERGGGGGFERVGSGGGSDRGGGGERIEGKVSDRLGSTERKTGGSQQQDRLGVSERGVGERLSGGGGGGEAVDRLGGEGVDKLGGGGGFQRVGSGGGSDRRRRSGGGGGGGSERGEYGNGSLVSESDENTSSWDRRMSGVDRMSDKSSSHGSDLHLRFADEPLYQFYNETVTKEELNKCYPRDESSRNSVADFDSDGYEEIGSDRLLISRPSAMDLITPKQGHHRTLWCEIPEVINSEILKTLSKDERRIQEAKFEVMTSEASYLKSLTVLEKHFANSAAFKDESVLPTEDRKSLFGHLTGVRRCSEKLLAALDRCWQESIMLAYLSEVVSQHAKQHFHVYVTYCSNQIDLNCTLRRLKDTNKRFEEELTRLESDPLCESLSLHSFLMLPMQRVTRMPLLMDAILSKLDTNHAEYQASKAALRILNEFVQKCNEATRQQERVIEMVRLSRQLEFMDDVRTLPLVSQSRWLVRSGQVVQLNSETIGQKQTFGRKLTRQGIKITLFLFNDVLLVAKKKGEESFLVLDHCPRNLIQMTAEDDVGNALKYLIKVAMLKNHEGKLVEMLVSCDSETCQQRWLQAFAPPQASEEGESIYEAWDCPQVIAIHSYQPQPLHSQPDELTLHPTDIINVTRKMADGWYYGERTRDGEKGWFPGNHVQEIISQHIRARNLQQRYRLLMMSGSILESQKGNTNHKKQK